MKNSNTSRFRVVAAGIITASALLLTPVITSAQAGAVVPAAATTAAHLGAQTVTKTGSQSTSPARVADNGKPAAKKSQAASKKAKARAKAKARSRTVAGVSASSVRLVPILRKAGFKGESLRTAWAVAMRESRGIPHAKGHNANGTVDHGLFQINDVHRKSGWINFNKLYDAKYAAKVAYRMTNQGRDWSSWAVGTKGWAGHLKRTSPQTWHMFNDMLNSWKAKFPG